MPLSPGPLPRLLHLIPDRIATRLALTMVLLLVVVLLPAAVPKSMVTFLHKEIVAVLQNPAVRARLMDEGGEVIGGTPQQYAAVIHNELAKWTKLVKAAGIRAE